MLPRIAAQRERPPGPWGSGGRFLPRAHSRVTDEAGSVLRGEGRRPHLRAHAPVDGVGGREDLRAAVVDAVLAPGVPARGPRARPVLEAVSYTHLRAHE